jgi:hypothetical protein
MSIIVKYNGGLGNQIFQWAAGTTLAKMLDTDLRFDMSFFKKRYARPYQMDIFENIELQPSNDIRTGLYWSLRKVKNFKSFLGLNIYHEKMSCFDEDFKKIQDNIFVEGFFQSERYFDPQLVLDLLKFKNPPQGLNHELSQAMQAENSVSLHVRRGDYVKKAHNKKVFNELTSEHFKKACEIIFEKVPNPRFYVFSDDPTWTKENIPMENAVYISHNEGAHSWEDLRLMSLCKHNIIANSSFSWWGAYLNKNPEKVVIAPKVWFLDPAFTNENICPPAWLRL